VTYAEKFDHIVNVDIPANLTPGMDAAARVRLWWWARCVATTKGIVLTDAQSEALRVAAGVDRMPEPLFQELWTDALKAWCPGLYEESA
jgi:hypothetical protein